MKKFNSFLTNIMYACIKIYLNSFHAKWIILHEAYICISSKFTIVGRLILSIAVLISWHLCANCLCSFTITYYVSFRVSRNYFQKYFVNFTSTSKYLVVISSLEHGWVNNTCCLFSYVLTVLQLKLTNRFVFLILIYLIPLLAFSHWESWTQ